MSNMSFLQLNVDDRRRLLATLDGPCDTMPRKRRRLDNLTPEERILRRKLKNRVAAQVARDRKKARMEELEELVVQLEKENDILKSSNDQLKARMSKLSAENNELRIRVGLTPPRTPPQTPPRTPPSSPVDHGYAAPCPNVSSTEVTTDLRGKQHVIGIKQEERFDEDDEVFHSNVIQKETIQEPSHTGWSCDNTISTNFSQEGDFNPDKVKVKVEVISDEESDCYDSYFTSGDLISGDTQPDHQSDSNSLLTDNRNIAVANCTGSAFIKVESGGYVPISTYPVKEEPYQLTAQPAVLKTESAERNRTRSSCISYFVNEKPFQSSNGEVTGVARRKEGHDEILLPEEQLNKIAAKLEPTFDDIWEDPFVDMFPPLMAL